MTKSQHDALIKFNQVSLEREMYVEREIKIKKMRSVSLCIFIFSVLLIALSQVVAHSAVILAQTVNHFIGFLPGEKYAFLVMGIISFFFLLVAVFRTISIQMKANKARKLEGIMAQRVFRLMLAKTSGQ